MEIEFNTADGLDYSPALEEHVRKKLGPVERRFGDKLTRVRVHLKDVNAHKGGVDIRCTMEARPAGLDPVGIEASNEDAYSASKAAADKLERALEHRLGRFKDTY